MVRILGLSRLSSLAVPRQNLAITWDREEAVAASFQAQLIFGNSG